MFDAGKRALICSIVIIFVFSTSIAVYADETGVQPEGRGLISINVVDADIRDVLSIFALSLDVGIIYLGEPAKVTFSAKDMAPLKALEMLLQSAGGKDVRLGYLMSGNLIIVGSNEKLQKDFFNQMALTRFRLSYITPGELNAQLELLDVPVKVITLAEGGKYIWAQGTPQALTKVGSVIAALDRAENFDSAATDAPGINLTPLNLRYITADRLERLILQLKINAQALRLDTNPNILWVNASRQPLDDILKLKEMVDVPASAGAEFEMASYRMKNITYDKLYPVLDNLDTGVRLLRVGSAQKQVWLLGEKKDIDDTIKLIGRMDVADNGEEGQFIVYTLRNISPEDAEKKLKFLALPGISAITLNYPQISHELLIKCPFDMIGAVTRVIASIDVHGQKIKAPVDYAKSAYQLTKRKELISKMMDIPPENLIISDDVSRNGEESYYIMWIEDTPDNIKRIKEMFALIDAP